MTDTKVIKVLRTMHSAFDHGPATLEYRTNQWTLPSVGKIYAFRDFESACSWAIDFPGTSLWEANAQVITVEHCMVCTNAHCHLWVFWKWYSLLLKGDVYMLPGWIGADSTPNGTVLCHRLMIVKKLKDM